MLLDGGTMNPVFFRWLDHYEISFNCPEENMHDS